MATALCGGPDTGATETGGSVIYRILIDRGRASSPNERRPDDCSGTSRDISLPGTDWLRSPTACQHQHSGGA